jgi:hypothetical protein
MIPVSMSTIKDFLNLISHSRSKKTYPHVIDLVGVGLELQRPLQIRPSDTKCPITLYHGL